MPEAERPPIPGPLSDPLAHLSAGAIEVRGRMPWSSNATFLVEVTVGEIDAPAVYKPGRGERPLWDFPDGLFRREVAAYELAAWLGWSVVPETVLRQDAPYGTGSLQRFVDADFEQHYFTLLENEEHHDDLRRIAAFDLLANNADRKSGHVLIDSDGQLWGIDNGLCFHDEWKLRTVMWDFAGEAVPEHLTADIARIASAGPEHVPASLRQLLHPVELEALLARAVTVAAHPCFPEPSGTHRDWPWPMV